MKHREQAELEALMLQQRINVRNLLQMDDGRLMPLLQVVHDQALRIERLEQLLRKLVPLGSEPDAQSVYARIVTWPDDVRRTTNRVPYTAEEAFRLSVNSLQYCQLIEFLLTAPSFISYLPCVPKNREEFVQKWRENVPDSESRTAGSVYWSRSYGQPSGSELQRQLAYDFLSVAPNDGSRSRHHAVRVLIENIQEEQQLKGRQELADERPIVVDVERLRRLLHQQFNLEYIREHASMNVASFLRRWTHRLSLAEIPPTLTPPPQDAESCFLRLIHQDSLSAIGTASLCMDFLLTMYNQSCRDPNSRPSIELAFRKLEEVSPTTT